MSTTINYLTLLLMDLSALNPNLPGLIFPDHVEAIPLEHCESGLCWIKYLEAATSRGLCGVLLPAFIPTSIHRLQDMHGVDLLDWLRWSGGEDIRCLPVLFVTLDPILAVMRSKPNLTILASGTEVYYLQNQVAYEQVLQEFVVAVQAGTAKTMVLEDLNRLASVLSADQSLTYHDLANEYYAASRLWEGYRYLLKGLYEGSIGERKRAICAELERVLKVRFPWTEQHHDKLRQPAVQRYFRTTRPPTAAPDTSELCSESLLRNFAANGLPSNLRLLLVDDEFDKGLADVLLTMMFRTDQFSSSTPDEAYLSVPGSRGAPWVRFACVKTTGDAKRWLNHWHGLNFSEEYVGNKQSQLQDKELAADKRNALREALSAVDQSEAVRRPITVVLLDLRLNRYTGLASASPELASTLFRSELKSIAPSIPVIMITASRQLMAYRQLMANAADADGWVTKEGPDVTPNDANSALWTSYLIAKLCMFSTFRDWHHPQLDWKQDGDKNSLAEYAILQSRPNWLETLDEISQTADTLVADLQAMADTFSARRTGSGGIITYVKNRCQLTSHEARLQVILIARRVIVWALLDTSQFDPDKKLLSWDPIRFMESLPEDALKGNPAKVSRFDQRVNFNDLLFSSAQPDRVLASLLREEYEWLLQKFANTPLSSVLKTHFAGAYPS